MFNILVVGDSCKDFFVYCDALRLAPDFPVPVLNENYISNNAGMSMNVYENLKKLNGQCDIITNTNWEKVSKTRFVHEESNHMFLRVDSKELVPRISPEHLKLVCQTGRDAIVIADYNKGFLEKNDIYEICKHHDCVFLDTKKPLGDWAILAKYIKINNYEYNNSLPLSGELFDKTIHTNGAQGCHFQKKHFPVVKVDVKDSSGAGDAFHAALVYKYLETKNITESIGFANEKASEVVKHKGVTIL